METHYIELYHALVMIMHEYEDYLAEEIAKDRRPMISALKSALSLMEETGQAEVF